jgi:hypothetical protein
MDVDRFVGLKSHGEQIFYRSRIEKFDKTDRRAASKWNATQYDHYEEKRKVILLQEKRDILKQMVDITSMDFHGRRAAHNGGGGGGGGGGGANLSSLAYRPTPRRGSNASVASGESWATFGSSRTASAPARKTSHRPPNVPKLNI